jgi:HSP20 family protein
MALRRASSRQIFASKSHRARRLAPAGDIELQRRGPKYAFFLPGDAMQAKFPRDWMWAEACELLARAERMHGTFFRPSGEAPTWEPPVDVLETDRAVLVLVALPGVNPDQVEAAIDGSDLVFSGTRVFPAEMQTAIIHRLELPQGRFERRIRLPAGRYGAVHRSAADGLLLIALLKSGAVGG